MARAPLRWAGSKRKSITALKAYVPEHYTKYIEPFAGSACLAFDLKPAAIALGDLNERLIEFYSFLKDQPAALHEKYIEFSVDQNTYYRVRKEYNDAAPSVERAARFLYLNRYCFNGIYRVNTRGEFNVPWGGDKVGAPLRAEEIATASEVLQVAALQCLDFERFIDAHVCEGAFVYLDPPYARDEARVFREYHESSFATADWPRLLSVLEKINDLGGKFLLSYAGDRSLMEQLSRWNVGHLDVTRNVGGFRASRRQHREFMATNMSKLRHGE